MLYNNSYIFKFKLFFLANTAINEKLRIHYAMQNKSTFVSFDYIGNVLIIMMILKNNKILLKNNLYLICNLYRSIN